MVGQVVVIVRLGRGREHGLKPPLHILQPSERHANVVQEIGHPHRRLVHYVPRRFDGGAFGLS